MNSFFTSKNSEVQGRMIYDVLTNPVYKKAVPQLRDRYLPEFNILPVYVVPNTL